MSCIGDRLALFRVTTESYRFIFSNLKAKVIKVFPEQPRKICYRFTFVSLLINFFVSKEV